MERHVVLAHELEYSARRRRPCRCATSAASRRPLPWRRPIRRAGDVFDGRVEPDVEDLALHAGPVLVAFLDRDAPVEIAGDAAILQAVAVVQPFLGDRGGQDGPVGLAVDPGVASRPSSGLAQIEVLGLAHFQIGRAGDGRARVDQVGRVELLGAVLALIAARAFRSRNWGRCPRCSGRAGSGRRRGIDLLLDTSPIRPHRPACRRNAGSARGSAGWTSARNDQS